MTTVHYQVGYALHRADHAMGMVLDAAVRPLGIAAAQAGVLLHLDRYPRATMAELSRLAAVTPQTMHRLVVGMERRGLVCRHRLDDDRKSLKVAITGKGADLLGRAELALMKALEDIGVYEVNEAFAPVPMAWLCETGADSARLNPNGGAIAMRHPLGASGARIMTTLINYMRDNGIRCGLQTMCGGGGTANCTIVELLD